VRALLSLLLLGAAGCSGFAAPSPDQLKALALAPPAGPPATTYERHRIRMSIDSPWLAGEFEGGVVARRGASPAVRAQLFGDLGPKALDVMARPDRIVGFFPQSLNGVDCALPAEAVPLPLLFLGVSLIEEFSGRSESRVRGIREEDGGLWVLLQSSVPGLEVTEFQRADRQWTRRRFRWIYGVTWEQERRGPDELTITASGVLIRVKILERNVEAPRNPDLLDLVLPADVRVVRGSRK